LSQIARNPVGGRIRRSGLPLLKASDLDQMQTVLREAGALPNEDPTVASASTPVPVALLNEVVSLVTGPGAAYGAPGADSLTKWRYALLDSNARLRVSVVGEFKAGKSSLINAIFGRDVCFVDEFEATTISATYSSGSEEVVTLFGEEGASDQWPLPTFLEHCAKRELDGVQKVVVTLPTDIPFDITDTPGLGSFTAGHENEAEEQIRRTDLLLWAVDCNDAGSARESAFIERARQIGLPVKVLLTKADVLSAGELDQLIAYFVSETGIPSDDVIAVSSLNYRSGNDSGMAALIERLRTAASERVAYQTASYNAKLQEIVEGSRLALRYLLEVNAPNARFLAAERGYLESSAAGIARTGKFEWLRILREECAAVTGSLEIHSVADVKVVEIVLSQALPEAVEKATAKFLSSLRKLVRDEWRGALEERSREFERRLAELMSTRPDAKADLDFLRTQRDEFRARAEVIGAESSVPSVDNRIWVMGLGAAASVLAVSFVPLAVAGVVAGFAMLDPKARGGLGPKADPLISARIEDALVSSFEDVAEAVEVAIDRIVAEVAIRSLIKLVNRRGGPDYHTVLVIEHKASDLMDEISAVQ